jgi:DNA-binding transcriptional ArsR family regulator
MTPPPDHDADLDRFARCGDDLVDAIDHAIEPWVRRSVLSHLPNPPPDDVDLRIRAAADRARDEVVPRLRDLLALDIDDQWTNPLSILRSAVTHPTAVLLEAGAVPVERDAPSRRLHPEDYFDLAPAAFGDLSPRAHEAGIVWGAAKAHLHLRRHGAKGDAPPDGGPAPGGPAPGRSP